MQWLPENKNDIAIKFIAFLLSPILGLGAALLRLRTRSSFIVLFGVLVTFGFSMVTLEDNTDDFGFDSVTYRQNFEASVADTWIDFQENLYAYIHQEGDANKDFYQAMMCFLVSRVSINYHVFFMAVAMVFAWFYLKTLRFFVEEEHYKLSVFCLLLLFLFSMNQVLKINAYRYYTALAIAVYATFQWLINKKPKYLILMATTPFFHASFIIMYAMIPMYYLVRKYMGVQIVFMIFGLIFMIMGGSIASLTQLIEGLLALLPESFSSHYDAYTDEFYMQHINESGSGFIWIRRILEWLSVIVMDAMVIFFYRHFDTNIRGTKCESMFRFLVFMATFVTLSILIPSLGSRFMIWTFPLIAYIYLVCFNEQRYRKILYLFAGFYLFIFLIVPFNIYQIPSLKYYTQLWEPAFIYSSPIYLFVKYIFV